MTAIIKNVFLNLAERVLLLAFGLIVAVFGLLAPKACLERLHKIFRF